MHGMHAIWKTELGIHTKSAAHEVKLCWMQQPLAVIDVNPEMHPASRKSCPEAPTMTFGVLIYARAPGRACDGIQFTSKGWGKRTWEGEGTWHVMDSDTRPPQMISVRIFCLEVERQSICAEERGHVEQELVAHLSVHSILDSNSCWQKPSRSCANRPSNHSQKLPLFGVKLTKCCCFLVADTEERTKEAERRHSRWIGSSTRDRSLLSMIVVGRNAGNLSYQPTNL